MFCLARLKPAAVACGEFGHNLGRACASACERLRHAVRCFMAIVVCTRRSVPLWPILVFSVTPKRIAELLGPFLAARLADQQLDQISIYIDLLLRWNARVNLTAVRNPEEIMTRHFGESLFAASQLLPSGVLTPVRDSLHDRAPAVASGRSVDLGSGAGFPGIPLKIWSPQTPVTLIESSHKKAAFLREVIRALTLTSIDVYGGRAETYPKTSVALVTLRAVERFASILSVANSLLAPGARLALLIGESQVALANHTLPELTWSSPISLPGSQSRALLIGTRGIKSVKMGPQEARKSPAS